jgi:iron complex transport system substrate-binding protein
MKSRNKESSMPHTMTHSRIGATVIRIIFCIILVAGLLHGCRSVSQADKATPIAFTDTAGQAVKLDRPPQRMVVVGQAPYILMHMLYMFPDAGRRLVGYEQKVKGLEDFVSLVDPQASSKAVLQRNPGPEHIAAVDPDLVLMKSSTLGSLEKALATIDIPAVHLDVENPDQFLQTIDRLGLLLGNPERAKEIRAYYQARIDRVTRATRDLSEDQKPRILFMKYGDRTGNTAMQVPGNLWIQTQQSQLSGGRPVWLDLNINSQNWQVVGFEQIALWNPDTIFLVVWYRLHSCCEVVNELTRDSKWRKLKAVADQRLFLMPEDIFSWDSPDPRWILGLLWMTSKTHPEMFGPWDIKAEVTSFFQDMFFMSPADIDAHILDKVAFNGCQ